MKQHPIPQNVTSYQFRLVGNMTLKQFLELAGGLLFAWLIYSSNLFFIIKLPLATIIAFLGLGMAFFPVEERPLDQWLINFFKAIYSPTRYIWQKSPYLHPIFTYKPPSPTSTPSSSQKAFKTTPPPTFDFQIPQQQTDTLESKQLDYINNLLHQFPSTPPTFISSSPSPSFHPPKPNLRPHQLKPKNKIIAFSSPQPTPLLTRPQSSPPPKPPTVSKPSESPSIPTIIFPPTPSPEKPSSPPTTTASKTLSTPSPLTPTKPNIITGLVKDKNGKLLPNIIVEILDANNIVQRATKTNALGQFSISTPLKPGNYLVQVDDRSLNIPSIKVKVSNQIIPPLILSPITTSNTN